MTHLRPTDAEAMAGRQGYRRQATTRERYAREQTVKAAIEARPGLGAALAALSFFRNRHGFRPRGGRGRNAAAMQKVDTWGYRRHARKLIEKARQEGFRGSICEALGVTAGEVGT